MEKLSGKCVLLGVTGGIAAYKMASVASGLRKAGAEVHVIMTENAAQFITPLTFETLTNHRCAVDTFARDFQYDVHHISLAKAADLILIAPATANVCAKLAHGLADDMLTTTVLACPCPKLIAPAMNTKMYENPVTQDNLDLLRRYGWEVIAPASGRLACGAVGSWPSPTTWRAGGSWSPPVPPRSPWTRCATSPTTPPEKWVTPSPGWPCSGERRSP